MKRFLCTVLTLAVLLGCMSSLTLTASAEIHSADYGSVKGYEDFSQKPHKFVYYPAELETGDKLYPVIAWANGTMCAPALYVGLFKALAQQGFVVVASSEMMSADGKEQIACVDYAFNCATDEQSVLCGKLDPAKIIAMGHSQGGRSSVNAAAADARFTCAVSIAGSNYKSEAQKLSAPTLFITGTADLIVGSKTWVKPAYEACQGPAVYASLKNAVHTTVCTNPDPYAKYAALWIRAWADNDPNAKKAFLQGGELSKDSKWQNFACKKMSGSTLTGSAFTDGSIASIAAIAEAFVIVGMGAVMVAKKKKETDGNNI